MISGDFVFDNKKEENKEENKDQSDQIEVVSETSILVGGKTTTFDEWYRNYILDQAGYYSGLRYSNSNGNYGYIKYDSNNSYSYTVWKKSNYYNL